MLIEDRKTQDFPTIPPTLADAELVALVLPFGEAVDDAHEHGGRVFGWGDFRLPRRALPLREEHDGKQIGILDSFVVARASGIWARVKLGHTAAALIAQGVTAISAEIDDGEISGAALVPIGGAAFSSARLFGSEIAALDSMEAPPQFGLSPKTMSIGFRPSTRTSRPTSPSRPTANINEHKREMFAASMASVDAEVEDRRRRFEERQLELAQQDDAEEELRLLAACVPTASWPPHLPTARRWREYEVQEQAKSVRAEGEVAAAAFEARMTELELKAERRPWWRWWK